MTNAFQKLSVIQVHKTVAIYILKLYGGNKVQIKFCRAKNDFNA